MNIFMMTLYYSVIGSASFNPNNLNNPPFMFNGFAASVARPVDSRPNIKPPRYSDLFDPNPPSYEKALELKKNEQLAAIQINSNINDAGNNVENTFAQLKPREKCFLLFKSIGLVLLTISMITMMVQSKVNMLNKFFFNLLFYLFKNKITLSFLMI